MGNLLSGVSRKHTGEPCRPSSPSTSVHRCFWELLGEPGEKKHEETPQKAVGIGDSHPEKALELPDDRWLRVPFGPLVVGLGLGRAKTPRPWGNDDLFTSLDPDHCLGPLAGICSVSVPGQKLRFDHSNPWFAQTIMGALRFDSYWLK